MLINRNFIKFQWNYERINIEILLEIATLHWFDLKVFLYYRETQNDIGFVDHFDGVWLHKLKEFTY